MRSGVSSAALIDEVLCRRHALASELGSTKV